MVWELLISQLSRIILEKVTLNGRKHLVDGYIINAETHSMPSKVCYQAFLTQLSTAV